MVIDDASVHVSTIHNNWHFTLHVLSTSLSVLFSPFYMFTTVHARGYGVRVTVVCWPHS